MKSLRELITSELEGAVYVQNCTPHRVLKNKTPEEVFSGKKPVSHLRIFSCPVYIHIEKEKRTRVYLWDTLKSQRLTEYTFQG